MKTAAFTLVVVSFALTLAFRESIAGTSIMWLYLGVPYLGLSGLALRKLHDDGTLLEVIRPRAGDFTIGSLVAAALYGGAYLVRHFVLTDSSPKITWLFRLSFQLGTMRPSPLVVGVVLLMAVLEELSWRGLVLSALTESLGARRAWPIAALSYGVAHAPTLVTLADPLSGLNPVLAIAAVGCGLVWSFVASLTGRLPPVVISHAVFSYFAFSTLLPRFG